MPLGIIRPHAAPFRGIRIGGPGPLALGSRNCPILTDVEVWFWLGCAEEQEIPEDFRVCLDQPMEGLLLRLECMAEMALGVQDVVAETVMGANGDPNPSPLLFPLAHITKRVRPRLIRAFFADHMPFVAPEPRVRVAGPTRRMVAAVARAIANPLDGGPYSVGCLLDIRGENRFAALANAVGGADASVLGRFRLDPTEGGPSRGELSILAPSLDGGDEVDGPTLSLDAHAAAALAEDVDALRELMADFVEEVSTLRLVSAGAASALSDRVGRLERRAPGGEELATVDEVEAYRTALTAHVFPSAQLQERVLQCERLVIAFGNRLGGGPTQYAWPSRVARA